MGCIYCKYKPGKVLYFKFNFQKRNPGNHKGIYKKVEKKKLKLMEVWKSLKMSLVKQIKEQNNDLIFMLIISMKNVEMLIRKTSIKKRKMQLQITTIKKF